MDDETMLIRRFEDLSSQADRRFTYTFSGFLNLSEQDTLLKIKNNLSMPASLYAPQDTSERKIAVFGSESLFGYPPEYPVCVLEIAPLSEKFAEDLTHRDYLGAVLNTGIDRSLTGDIIIREKHAWIYCLTSIAEFLKDSLKRVRHTEVQLKCASMDIPELTPVFEELRINVASERLDAIASAFTGITRSKIMPLFTQQQIFINSRIIENPAARLKEGDVLNIRGYGKAIYEGIDGVSKKGRLYVVLKKYV